MTGGIQRENILLNNIISIIKDMKGIDIMSLDLRKLENPICEHFIICTGSSDTHTNAIEQKIKKQISELLKEKPWHTEGINTGNWLLMDYSNIVVHIFQKNTRNFYQLEELWGDAEITKHLSEKKILIA
ncbi:MAG: ribosome silencing factor [Bacteroidota bacterium]|nr:ribosome silencing factor [Bacteroidota bacterium]